MDDMEYMRLARLYGRVFGTPQGSQERERAIAQLSDNDLEALYNFEMSISKGDMKRPNSQEMEEIFIWD